MCGDAGYLSDELYSVVKSQGLSPPGLLQDAVRAHCERQEKIRLAHEYVQEMYAELGPPGAEDIEWADAKAREITESLRAGAEAVAAQQWMPWWWRQPNPAAPCSAATSTTSVLSPTTPTTSPSRESDNDVSRTGGPGSVRRRSAPGAGGA